MATENNPLVQIQRPDGGQGPEKDREPHFCMGLLRRKKDPHDRILYLSIGRKKDKDENRPGRGEITCLGSEAVKSQGEF